MLQPPPIKRETQLHGYLFKRELGSGQFSVVWEAMHLKSNEIVAIKCVRLFSQQTRERHLGEIEIMKKLDHPFIVRYFDSFEEEDVLLFVFGNDRYVFNKVDLEEYGYLASPRKVQK